MRTVTEGDIITQVESNGSVNTFRVRSCLKEATETSSLLSWEYPITRYLSGDTSYTLTPAKPAIEFYL